MKKFIAVFMSLALSACLCSCSDNVNDETTTATTDASTSSTTEQVSQSDSSKASEQSTNGGFSGVIWESEDYESASELSQKLGIEIREPKTEGAPQYMIISGILGQIDFAVSSVTYCLRAADVSSGLSGSSFYGIDEANFTSDGEIMAVKTAQVTFKNTIDGATVALWQVGNAMYSLFSADASEEQFNAVLEDYIA